MSGATTLGKLLDERNEIAALLAHWRKRWDAALVEKYGSADRGVAGLKPLDDYAFELAYRDQTAPIAVGGNAQPPLPSSGRDFQ